MTVFFTSDTHFGHANIIKYCNRPYSDVAQMDAELIRRWNMVVNYGDTVFHLGDFAFANEARVEYLLNQLRGIKILIAGNHDPKSTRRARGWAQVHMDYSYNLGGPDGPLAHLIHKPNEAEFIYRLRELGPNSNRVVLHGHTHGSRGYNPYEPVPGVRYLDVGVDTWGADQLSYTPASEAQILMRLKGTKQ